MPDPSGSGQEVPILGAEKDRNTGKIIPLGGTMEDPEGAGKIIIPPANYVCGRVYCFHVVRKSDRPTDRVSETFCFFNNFKNH